MSLNKVQLIGYTAKPADVRVVGESKVASFSLATTEKYRGKDGNIVENTEWHNVVIWGKPAEVAEKYIQKGTLLYVEGKLKTEKYTDKDGIERFTTKVRANSLQLLGGKPDTQSQPAQAQPANENRYGSTPMPTVDDMPDDDLPF